MSSYAAPVQIAAVFAAIVWPLAAALALVLWTRARAAERRRRLTAIERGLQVFFQTVEGQPIPGRLEMVVDALEEHLAIRVQAKAAARRRRKDAKTS